MATDVATVLLFEQDRATRQLYARELGRHWQVIAVDDAAECMDLLVRQAVTAVVFELRAVNKEEWALLGAIVRLATPAGAPVIVCSAIDARSQGYASGVSAYLVKPVLPQQLIGEVARCLGNQTQREKPMRGDYLSATSSSQPFTSHDE
jgi:DNA-binding NtrC family response regulator